MYYFLLVFLFLFCLFNNSTMRISEAKVTDIWFKANCLYKQTFANKYYVLFFSLQIFVFWCRQKASFSQIQHEQLGILIINQRGGKKLKQFTFIKFDLHQLLCKTYRFTCINTHARKHIQLYRYLNNCYLLPLSMIFNRHTKQYI